MADTDVRVPAGWYPDPLGLPQLRWWDNHAWTEYTSDARQPMVAQETLVQQARLAYADDDTRATPITSDTLGSGNAVSESVESEVTSADGLGSSIDSDKPTAEALLSLEAPLREDLVVDEISPAAKFAEFVPNDAGPNDAVADDAVPATAFNLDARFDDLLGDGVDEAPLPATSAFAHVSASTTTFVPATAEEVIAEPVATPVVATDVTPVAAAAPASATSTPFAWIIALSPVYALIAAMFALLGGTEEQGNALVPLVVLLVPWFGVIVLAYLDNRRLTARGFTTAHWGLALLGAPIYLIARTVLIARQTGRGFAPLGTWFGMLGLLIASALVIPGLVISVAPQLFAHEASHSLEDQARALGANITVDCSPQNIPTIVGQSFICLASRGDGATWGVNVSLVRSDGWINWEVTDWGPFRLTENGQI